MQPKETHQQNIKKKEKRDVDTFTLIGTLEYEQDPCHGHLAN